MKVFLSQHICQDPLERFYGMQWQHGIVNDNPNVQEFLKNTQAIRVIKGVCNSQKRGNCRGRTEEPCINDALALELL